MQSAFRMLSRFPAVLRSPLLSSSKPLLKSKSQFAAASAPGHICVQCQCLRPVSFHNRNEYILRRFHSTSSLLQKPDDGNEDTLTPEEQRVLQQLEEEERKFRESIKSGKWERDDQDYSLWSPEELSRGGTKGLQESVSEGHVPFANQQRIIQDVIDEMWNPLPQPEIEPEEPVYYPRGKTGVFDLGELVDLLKNEGGDELVAIALPKEIDYADFMVIVTVSNNRQLVALATFVRKRYKMKDRKPTDVLPELDKKANHHGWIALDLGNIILQIFIQEVRDYFDLETLWTVGPVFDDLSNVKDSEIVQLLNSIQ